MLLERIYNSKLRHSEVVQFSPLGNYILVCYILIALLILNISCFV